MMEKEYETISGEKRMIKISDVACARFGFKHGNKIITPQNEMAVAIGIGGNDFNEREVFWYMKEGFSRICYEFILSEDDNVENIFERGFKKLTS